MTVNELLRLSKKDLLSMFPTERCMECKSPLDTGDHRYGRLCEDCYYNKVGDLIELHPIWHPRRRRG